jgi:hypothetical protein
MSLPNNSANASSSGVGFPVKGFELGAKAVELLIVRDDSGNRFGEQAPISHGVERGVSYDHFIHSFLS